MNLFEISQEYLDVLEHLEVNEDGEITNIEELEQIQDNFTNKVEGIGCFIKQLEIEAEDLKKVEESYYLRRKAKENLQEKLKAYVSNNLTFLEMNKFETTKVKISFRKSTKVNIIDKDLIPQEYLTVKTTVDPNKTAIKDAIKNGIEVAGATIEECQNIQIK